MKILFDYCYYRISKFYKSWESKDYCLHGGFVLFFTFAFIFLSILALICYLLHKRIDAYVFTTIGLVICSISFFFLNKKKYEELEQRYKDEKYSKLKGWLVLLYIISSAVLFFVSIGIFNVEA